MESVNQSVDGNFGQIEFEKSSYLKKKIMLHTGYAAGTHGL